MSDNPTRSGESFASIGYTWANKALNKRGSDIIFVVIDTPSETGLPPSISAISRHAKTDSEAARAFSAKTTKARRAELESACRSRIYSTVSAADYMGGLLPAHIRSWKEIANAAGLAADPSDTSAVPWGVYTRWEYQEITARLDARTRQTSPRRLIGHQGPCERTISRALSGRHYVPVAAAAVDDTMRSQLATLGGFGARSTSRPRTTTPSAFAYSNTSALDTDVGGPTRAIREGPSASSWGKNRNYPDNDGSQDLRSGKAVAAGQAGQSNGKSAAQTSIYGQDRSKSRVRGSADVFDHHTSLYQPSHSRRRAGIPEIDSAVNARASVVTNFSVEGPISYGEHENVLSTAEELAPDYLAWYSAAVQTQQGSQSYQRSHD